ncbi:MAG: hypothetical protein ACM3RP_11790, partial [Chitinophagales bacterium]
LQEDYHLRRDGLAGRQVASLLRDASLPALRHLHTLGPDEDSYSVAERYGVTPGLVRRLTTLGPGRRLVPGSQLVLPVRPVLVQVERDAEGGLERLRRVLVRHRAQVTALVAPWLELNAGGVVTGKVDPGVWALAQELRLPLVARLKVATSDGLVPGGRVRRLAVPEVARVAARYGLPGVCLAFGELARGERYPAAALLAAVQRALPASTQLYLEAPTAPEGEDLAAAGHCSPDRLVLRLPGEAAGEEAAALVRQALRRFPCHRVFFGLSAATPAGQLGARLAQVVRQSLGGVALYGLGSGPEHVFRVMADLFSVQGSEAATARSGHIQSPGA